MRKKINQEEVLKIAILAEKGIRDLVISEILGLNVISVSQITAKYWVAKLELKE